MRISSGIRIWSLCLLLAGAYVAGEERKPARSGRVERVETSVVLLDVEVTDLSGAPLPGLRKEDFQLRVDGWSWPIYSVDDLCSCPPEPGQDAAAVVPAPETRPAKEASPPASGALSAAAPPPAETPNPRSPPAAGGMLYVLYFDYSQLQLGGRRRAADAAVSWIREVMQPGERAMVVAYASKTKVYAQPMADKEALIAAVEASYEDPLMVDVFPNKRDPLASLCQMGSDGPDGADARMATRTNKCVAAALAEQHHALLAFRALETLLETLALHPGRKALLYFHENSTLVPAQVFGQRTLSLSSKGGELVRTVEEIAADATESRTKIYTAFVGNTADAGSFYAHNLGVNFSDKTGGRHNRTRDQLPALLRTAGREGCCLYRIGIRPPWKRISPRLRWARITTRGVVRPAVRAFRFLGSGERWRRRAMAVLKVPEAHEAIPLAAAIVPLGRNGKRWRADLLLATQTAALLDIPEGRGGVGEWGVGAYLETEGRSRRYEGFSSMRVPEVEHQPPLFVYHDSVEVRPGHLELRAYLGRVEGAEFGGAQASLDFPRSDARGIAGPVLLLGQERQLAQVLPPEGSGSESTPAPAVGYGAVPLGLRPIAPGDLLLVRSFLCVGKGESPPEGVRRYVTSGGEPLFKLPSETGSLEQGCLEIEDRLPISAEGFPPGEYTYHLEWNWPGKEGGEIATRSFRVGPMVRQSSKKTREKTSSSTGNGTGRSSSGSKLEGPIGVRSPLRLVPGSRVEPVYPEKYRKEGIEAKVILQIVIRKDGSVGKMEVLLEPKDHPDFAKAAIEAVREWRYEPTRLQGRTVETVTVAIVKFVPEPGEKDTPE